MKKIIIVGLAFFLMAFGEKHSDVEISSSKEKDLAEVLFKVKAHDSYLITIEAPWKIILSNPKGIKFENGKDSFISKKMSEAIPGFKEKVTIDSKAKVHSFDYKIKAFVCTKDKKDVSLKV